MNVLPSVTMSQFASSVAMTSLPGITAAGGSYEAMASADSASMDKFSGGLVSIANEFADQLKNPGGNT